MCSAKSTHPREYRSDAGVKLESRAYSGAVVSDFRSLACEWANLDNLTSIVFEVVNERPLPGRHISSMTHLAVTVVLSDSNLIVSNRPICQLRLK